jgi:outer membrane protein assembly factor BamB
LNRLSNFALTLSIILFSVHGSADDWPQWRGIHRDGKSAETGLLKEWPAEGPKLLWQVEGVGEGHASMSVSKGRIYTTGMLAENNEGMLSAIDLDGMIVWQTKYGPEWTEGYPGARSCPTVDGDRIYIVSGTGRAVCFDAKTGAIVWSKDLVAELGAIAPRMGFAESPLVIDNAMFCTPGGKQGSVAALDKLTGRTISTTKSLTDLNAYCSPIFVERGKERLIVTILATQIVGIDEHTSNVFWSTPFDENEELQNHAVSPIYEDGRIYATSAHRKGGVMITLSDDGKSVTPGWKDETLNTLHGGLVFVDGYIYGSNTRGKWVCLDAATGKVMYETAGVGMGSIIYADSMLYCYGDKGTLGIAKATPTGYTLVSSFKIDGGKGPYWAHPVISDGRLYVRHNAKIMAYDIRAK